MKFQQAVSCYSLIESHLKVYLTILIVLVFFSSVNAQTTCRDSLPINQYFQCTQESFEPVCGCTQKTYRNDCVRLNVYGVRNAFSGVCKKDVFYFEFNPNPASEKTTFDIKFFDQGNYSMQIFDSYGKLMYYEHQANVQQRKNDIYVNTFKPGFYLFTITSGSIFRTKKFIVR